MADQVVDIHTQSNYRDVPVRHMSMHLTLHMNEKIFYGYVDLQIENSLAQSSLILDTKSLVIVSTAIGSSTASNLVNVAHTLRENQPVLGQALEIPIEPTTRLVRVHYQTTEKSVGLDWIAPNLTSDHFPMVVTQFQAINARTFVPCQDTPANKITYDATIALKSDIDDKRMKVLMAADQRKKNADGTYSFAITKPIPTYLIALAAGVFEERKISDRVSVFAEPSFVDKAAAEFNDAENMVATAERILGPYAWGRFDIFIMPPSFSYGGMENPTMTFIGRTVVAGDKSLVDVIAHELAHSWSGNYVTNRTWNDFWINEGTTMYIERLIVDELYGTRLKDLDIVLGQQILLDNMKDITQRQKHPELTKLHLNLSKTFDPDDAVSHVPYEKGFNFWLALEQAYGKDAVLKFLKDYFAQFAFGSCDTRQLHDLIEKSPHFDGAKKVDLDDWLYHEQKPKSGLPAVVSEAIQEAHNFIEQVNAQGLTKSALSLAKHFDTKQWCYVLRKLETLTSDHVIKLDGECSLLEKNDEVRYHFFVSAINAGLYHTYEQAIDSYLGNVGRVKYIAPIYIALEKNGLIKQARMLFEKHRMHNNLITNGYIMRSLKIL